MHPISPQRLLFPQMKKVLKGKRFANVEEVGGSGHRSIERHQNQRVQKLFSAGEKTSIGTLHAIESILKVTKV